MDTEWRRRRRLNGVLGLFLIAVAAISLGFLRGELLSDPVLTVQIGLLGVAGVGNVAAAVDSLSTARWGWYRWSGLANVCLGVSLPLGLAEDEPAMLVIVGLAGLSLAAMGLDLLLFRGTYIHGRQFDHRSS